MYTHTKKGGKKYPHPGFSSSKHTHMNMVAQQASGMLGD